MHSPERSIGSRAAGLAALRRATIWTGVLSAGAVALFAALGAAALPGKSATPAAAATVTSGATPTSGRSSRSTSTTTTQGATTSDALQAPASTPQKSSGSGVAVSGGS